MLLPPLQDYNYIEDLQSAAFRALTPRRLFLGMNRIKHIDDEAFKGAEEGLELVDLEGNDLNNVSYAFAQLKGLRYLYLPNNNISELSPQVR